MWGCKGRLGWILGELVARILECPKSLRERVRRGLVEP